MKLRGFNAHLARVVMVAAMCAASLDAAPAYAGQAADARKAPRPFDATSLGAIKSDSAGRPFVLAFWSTLCEPCRHEMPVWRAMSKAHPDLRIVLVAADQPSQWNQAERFLKRYPPGRVEIWAFGDDAEERIRYSIDPRWRGELPRTYLYDARHEREAVIGVADRTKVEKWLATAR